MSWGLIVLLGVLTYASRALAVVFLPHLPMRARAALDRMPPALFAGLAAQALVGPGASVADPRVLAAAAGALIVTPMRSLAICLAAGLATYLVAGLL